MLAHAKPDLIQQPSSWFKTVCSSSHEQSVPTCTNKSVNNTVVQACQQQKQVVRFYVCDFGVQIYLPFATGATRVFLYHCFNSGFIL